MIVTTTKMDWYTLVLIACHAGQSRRQCASLMSVDWLPENHSWYESKSLTPLKKNYKLNDDDFEFIESSRLNRENTAEALLIKAISQIDEYLAGKRQNFEIALALSLGTPFQQTVWQALQKIPYGQTISYAQLAQKIGKPTAYRAVANANGKNPFSVIIPCHRVVASGGGLGGYTGGIDKKRFLLTLEKK